MADGRCPFGVEETAFVDLVECRSGAANGSSSIDHHLAAVNALSSLRLVSATASASEKPAGLAYFDAAAPPEAPFNSMRMNSNRSLLRFSS